MANYYFTLPTSVTLPTDGNKVSLTTDCELHRDDGALPNVLTVDADSYNVFLADTPGSGTATAPDVTAPTLSSATDAADGATASTALVSTDEGNGTLYWVVTTSGTAPSAAQVKAGQDNSGSAATDSGSQSVSGTGVQTISPAPSGLTASTAYTTHFMHEDAATNQSTVASASGFTTAAAASAPTVIGGAGNSARVYGTSLDVPLHADSLEGHIGIVVIGAKTTSASVTPPAGWSRVGTRQFIGGDSYFDVFSGAISSGQETAEEASFTFDANHDCHGVSMTLDSGTVGNFSVSSGTGGSPVTCPSITVSEDSATVGIAAIAYPSSLTSMSPAVVADSQPTGSPSRSLGITAVEDESAGSSSSISFVLSGGPNWAAISLEVSS